MDAGSSSTTTPYVDKDVDMAASDENQQKLEDLIDQWTAMTFEDSAVPTLVQKVLSNEQEEYHYGLIGLRKLLSKENDPPIQAVIDAGVVPRLVQLTSLSSPKKVQFEAAWCLTNVCSGTTEQTRYVIENGALASFLSLLKSDDSEVVEQSVWGLGNIAGDNSEFRDQILQQNGTEELVKVLSKATSLSLKRNGAWALSNLCRGKPAPPFALVFKAIPQLCELLAVETDSQTLVDVAWGLSYLTDSNEGISSVLSCNAVPKLIEFLSHTDIAIVTPCLRTIGNIISGNDDQTSVVLKEKNFIPELFKLADNKKKAIRREAFWTLSNITAGTPVQFEAIMGNPAYVEKLIYAAKNDVHEVKKEALWALSNSTATCTPAQIIRILDNGVFGCLVDLLVEQDTRFLMVALEGVENCLKWGEQFNIKDESGTNKFVVEMENRGGIDKVEALQAHQSNDVYEKAVNIIERYFAGEEDLDYAEQPAVGIAAGNNNGFTF